MVDATTYAELGSAKMRLDIPDTDTKADQLIQLFCEQVNGWIESKTGRILHPYPAINATVASGGGAGSTAVTLSSGAGVVIGDSLMFGPVSGTHEHSVAVDTTGNVVTLQTPLVNSYSADAPVTWVQIFDGDDALEGGRMLPVTNGLVTVTSVEIAFYTGGAFGLVPQTDYFLRPLPLDREPGWPATELWMTNFPTNGSVSTIFARGMGNVRVACTPGWPAIPTEITGLALNIVTTYFRRRGVGGGGDTIQTGSDGARTISLLLDSNDWRTINRYTAKEVLVV